VKRTLDLLVAVGGLLALSPVLLLASLAVWAQDRHNPFYIATRSARGGGTFRMVKLRSMLVRADRLGGDSTAGDDPRITTVGKIIRKAKLDEFTQLWNVMLGDMSLVGPRPNTPRATDGYTPAERRLLTARPGITDLASIVFSDEGEILRGAPDPDLRYEQVIRPWKSRLALLYVDRRPSIATDILLVWLTVRSAWDRPSALQRVAQLVTELGGDAALADIARREAPLSQGAPPV
jgi:lipopolysaccharide/colanic/teichoic acid biosynthesis glycosyltransferase